MTEEYLAGVGRCRCRYYLRIAQAVKSDELDGHGRVGRRVLHGVSLQPQGERQGKVDSPVEETLYRLRLGPGTVLGSGEHLLEQGGVDMRALSVIAPEDQFPVSGGQGDSYALQCVEGTGRNHAA